MFNMIKKYIRIGLISLVITSAITVPLVYRDFQHEKSRRIAFQRNMEKGKLKLIEYVKETYNNFIEPNDLTKLFTHIKENYKTD